MEFNIFCEFQLAVGSSLQAKRGKRSSGNTFVYVCSCVRGIIFLDLLWLPLAEKIKSGNRNNTFIILFKLMKRISWKRKWAGYIIRTLTEQSFRINNNNSIYCCCNSLLLQLLSIFKCRIATAVATIIH